MHNTNPSQTSNNIYATARDAVNPDFAGLTNTEENQEFVMALEARILYARGTIRAVIGCTEEAEEMMSGVRASSIKIESTSSTIA